MISIIWSILLINKKKETPKGVSLFIFLKKKDYFMSTKIKNSILISNVSDSIKIPIGNYELDDQPYGISVEQLKYHINSGLSNVATTGSYNDLLNKPDLNIYAKVSTLNKNYYNKTEIDALITGGEGAGFLKMEFVNKLPTKGEANTFYFVKSEFPKEQNLYDEYVWNEKEQVYEVVSKTDYITEKQVGEMIPTVYDSQITIKQGDTVKGTFSLNQSQNLTITLDAPPTNTRSLLITYEDGTTETIKVYTA